MALGPLAALARILPRRSESRGKIVLWATAFGLVATSPAWILAAVVPLGIAAVVVMASTADVPDSGCTPSSCSPTSAAPIAVSGSKVELARNLIESGKLVPLYGATSHLFEIQDVAAGSVTEGCDVDIRILAILTLLVQRYDSVGFSDINRRCTGQIEGAGTLSSHWVNGGGNAIDLVSINGVALDGGDRYSLEIIALLGPLVPADSRVGQVDCRGATALGRFTTFEDDCNHLHLDVAQASGNGLLLLGAG